MGTLAERFWSKVDKSGGPDACWPWQSYLTPDGYGETTVSRKKQYTHRVAWCLSNNVNILDLATGTVVRHTCDNPPCCNPEHLLPGTQLDNIQDRKNRKRGGCQSGEAGRNAHLTEDVVVEIRRLCREGLLTQEEIAHLEGGVTRHAVSSIHTRRSWSGVN